MIKYLWKNTKVLFVLQCAITLAVSAALIYLPRAVGEIVESLVYDEYVNIGTLLLRFFLTLVVAQVVLLFCYQLSHYQSSRRKKTLEMDLSRKLVSRLRNQSDVINIYNQEIALVERDYLSIFFDLLQTLGSFCFAIILGLSISWIITLCFLIATIALILLTELFTKRNATLSKFIQDRNIALNRINVGIFSSLTIINIFNIKKIALAKIEGALEDKRIGLVRKGVFDTNVSQLNNFLGWIIQFGLIIGAYISVHNGTINIGQAATLVLLNDYLSSPMFRIARCRYDVASTLEIRNKLLGILSESEEIMSNKPIPKCICLDNISYSYIENEKFMTNVTLTFDIGKRYLIVGKSGSGKSTLLRLLLKQLSPSEGNITFGDVDVEEINSPTWYSNIAYTGQTIEIIPGTLRENIILEKPYNEEHLNKVLDCLNIGYLTRKLDVPLDEDTGNFSGGELQRVAIARMIYDDSPIFIFDEFSSALDNVNARQIEEVLLKIKGKLLINVSHRIHNHLINNYDEIIVMEEGKIVRSGSPATMENVLKPYMYA